MAESKKKYELVADHYHETTSKPGDPFTYKAYVKGDTIELDAEQAQRLLAADAVKVPGEKTANGEKPGGQTKPPTGKADGVGDGDAKAGQAGDGGPEPAGTGSTAPGDGGGPGDGQGSAEGNPAASTARTGRRSGGRQSQGAQS